MTPAGIASTTRGLSDTSSARSQDEIIARCEAIPFTPLHTKARLAIGSATFFDAFNVIAIASVLPVLVNTWKLAPGQIGWLISVGFAGQVVGSLFFPWLSERIGRVRTTAYTVALFGVTSILCALAWNYESFLVLRTLQGLGLGGELPVAAAYINEISKTHARGRFVILYELVFSVGLLVANAVGAWAVPHWGWQSMFYIGAVAALPAIIIRYGLPESPRWLAAKGRLGAAEAALRQFEKSAGPGYVPAARADLPLLPIRADYRWRELVDRTYLRRTLVVWAIWITGGMVGFGITTWLPTFYRTVYKLPLAESLRLGIYPSLAALLGVIACALLIDKIGRRAWMAAAFSIGGIALLIVYALPTLSAVTVAIFASISYCFVAGAFITAYTYTPEVYPTRFRAFGVGVASAILRGASTIAPIIVGYIVANGAIGNFFLMNGLVTLTTGVIVYFFAIETKRRVLEEISA